MQWLKVKKPTPVLNTPNFCEVFSGKSLPVSDQGHLLYFEFVAIPGMHFQFLKKTSPYIIEVQWAKYDVKPLYIDCRFVTHCSNPLEKKESLYSAPSLLAHMQKRIGTPYLWGGNWAEGIPEVIELYPPSEKLSSHMKKLWTFRGLDCSGLLFEASNGATPRNTSSLVNYGKPLDSENFSNLLPMDMIVYPGHVLFVVDSKTIIESKSPFGVRYCLLNKRLEEIFQERKFVRVWDNSTDSSSSFTIRRFAF
jgi:hypothetical protein